MKLTNTNVEKLIDNHFYDHFVYYKFIKEYIVKQNHRRQEFHNIPPLADQMIDNFLRIFKTLLFNEINNKFLSSSFNDSKSIEYNDANFGNDPKIPNEIPKFL